MQRLSGLDASFLYLETPSHHMHVSMTAIFDPSSVPGGYSFDKLKEFIGSRLHLVPQMRRRLLQVPLRLHHPVWVEEEFDLDYHVRRIGVPAPGGIRELAEVAGDIASRQLDRSKPLWEITIAEGLEDGNIGFIAKMHHSTIDGVSGADMMVHLFDLEADPAPLPAPEQQPAAERAPNDLELVAYALASRVRAPWQVTRTMVGVGRSLVGIARQRRATGASSGTKAPLPLTAPATSLNGAITAHRKVAFAGVALDDVKRVKNAFGTTVNDVILALCAGALRKFLDENGELPDKSLVAVCPVSVRGKGGKEDGANVVSAMFVSLPTDLDDPVERLMAIHESTKGAKEEHKALDANLLMDITEFAPPTLFNLASRLYSSMKLADRHRPIHNLIISNVPGPDFPLYLGGCKLVAGYPMGPVMEGAGLNVTVMSYLGNCNFGFMACRETVPRVWDIAHHVTDAMQELLKAADAQGKK